MVFRKREREREKLVAATEDLWVSTSIHSPEKKINRLYLKSLKVARSPELSSSRMAA